MRELAEVDPELDRDRLVEPVAVGEVVADRGGGPLAERRLAGVAREDARQANTRNTTPKSTGMLSSRRRRMKRSMVDQIYGAAEGRRGAAAAAPLALVHRPMAGARRRRVQEATEQAEK